MNTFSSHTSTPALLAPPLPPDDPPHHLDPLRLRNCLRRQTVKLMRRGLPVPDGLFELLYSVAQTVDFIQRDDSDDLNWEVLAS